MSGIKIYKNLKSDIKKTRTIQFFRIETLNFEQWSTSIIAEYSQLNCAIIQNESYFKYKMY